MNKQELIDKINQHGVADLRLVLDVEAEKPMAITMVTLKNQEQVALIHDCVVEVTLVEARAEYWANGNAEDVVKLDGEEIPGDQPES